MDTISIFLTRSGYASMACQAPRPLQSGSAVVDAAGAVNEPYGHAPLDALDLPASPGAARPS